MRVLAFAVLAAVGLATAAAAADSFTPVRKPGLWRQSMSINRAGGQAQTMKSTLCREASVDKAAATFGSGVGKPACSRTTITKTPTGYSFASVCELCQAGG